MDIIDTIIREVANLEETDPKELPPIYSVLDPESLENLIKSANNADIVVRFDYFEYNICVKGNSEVQARGMSEKGSN